MGGWKDIEFDLASNSPSPVPSDASSSGSPDKASGSAQTWLDAADMNIYGPGGVGAGDQRIVACNDCNKPVLEGALADHRVNCKRARELQAAKSKLSNGNGVESKKRSLSDASGDDSSPAVAKKPKYLPGGDEKLKKKTSILVKPPDAKKPPRSNKGPVDLNTQCGVIIGDNKPCARSLTCKSHSMAQKRDVPGRSAPYKQLLAEWQARHNPEVLKKQQAAHVSRTLPSEGKSAPLTPASTSKLASEQVTTAVGGVSGKKGKAKQLYFGQVSDSEASGEEEMGDSEDEVEQVFAGLTAAKSICRPMAEPTLGGALCVRAIKYGRFRDALFGAATA